MLLETLQHASKWIAREMARQECSEEVAPPSPILLASSTCCARDPYVNLHESTSPRLRVSEKAWVCVWVFNRAGSKAWLHSMLLRAIRICSLFAELLKTTNQTKTTKNQILEKCAQCVLLLITGYICVIFFFWLTTGTSFRHGRNLVLLKFELKQSKFNLSGIGSIPA